jgi:hypothetical protein
LHASSFRSEPLGMILERSVGGSYLEKTK